MYIFKRFMGLILLALPLCMLFYVAYRVVDIYLAVCLVVGIIIAFTYFILAGYLLTAQKPQKEVYAGGIQNIKERLTLLENELRFSPQEEVKKCSSKKELVNKWQASHPKGTKKECEEALGISRTTINKWWE